VTSQANTTENQDRVVTAQDGVCEDTDRNLSLLFEGRTTNPSLPANNRSDIYPERVESA